MADTSYENTTNLTIVYMKERLISMAIALLSAIAASGQTYSIRGTVVDSSEKDTPLPLAKVQLLRTDSSVVSTNTTANNGTFRFTPKAAGRYIVRISFLGYETLCKDLEVTKKRPSADLGKLRLEATDVKLGEAQVTGLAAQLTIKADTFVYHTSAQRLPPGSSLSALVKQMPGFDMDSEGNLTFQGKAVKSVLINGKEFFGDTQSALINMPAEALQNVKTYDKTDEEIEFRGGVDPNKQTVLDLSIKKEYLASWNINADTGYGTHERYIGKAFASTFTDRRRMALYGSVNNISENQRADENGNWTYYGGAFGLYTYRSTGLMYSYDNGKKSKEKGYFKMNANIKGDYNNSTTPTIQETEHFLQDGTAQYGYQNNHSWRREPTLNASANMTYTLDTLNRFELRASYYFRNYRSTGDYRNSVYAQKQEFSDPASGLLGEDIRPELQEEGIYSMKSDEIIRNRIMNGQARLRYTHRLKNRPRGSIMTGIRYSTGSNRYNADFLTHYLYFRPDAPQPSLINRQYDHKPSNNTSFDGGIIYTDAISKHLTSTIGYSFEYEDNDENRLLYQLDRDELYNSMLLPAGARPELTEALLNENNTLRNTTRSRSHTISGGLEGNWDKVEATFEVEANHNDMRLKHINAGKVQKPGRKFWQYDAYAYLKWKYAKDGSLRFYYNTYSNPASLISRIDRTDDSNVMQININNPNLKDSRTHYANTHLSYFNSKTGGNYTLYFYYNTTQNSPQTVMAIDPVTGVKRLTTENINGNYNLGGSFYIEQPLDTARHWTLSTSASTYFSRSRTYTGTAEQAKGLSVLNSLRPRIYARLRYRQGIYSVSAHSSWSVEIARYNNLKAYNQTGHTIEAFIAPQVDLPFGLKINTDFGYYVRTGYANALLNHGQWLWNASTSYSFLKNKALTLQLQAVDILHQRTAESNYLSTQSRSFSRTETFLSYVLFHVIYRFNLKR